MSEPLLRCHGLHVSHGPREVVHDVTFELYPGEIVALLGPNGAGKSTLLHALAGLLQPSSGQLELSGRVAIALQSAELARRSALVNVALGLAWWGVPRAEREPRARAALRLMGADQLADRSAANLSGGERRRVHLARALAVAPEVLLLDEPFAGLDLEARASLVEDSVTAMRSPARATLVVVHDRSEAWALADRLLVMLEGRLVACGAPAELLASPPTAAVARFLGYDGELRDGDAVTLTRSAQVVLDPTGPLQGRVTRAIRVEDGVRLELALANGRLSAVHAGAGAPRPGDEVRLRITRSVSFYETVAPERPQERSP